MSGPAARSGLATCLVKNVPEYSGRCNNLRRARSFIPRATSHSESNKILRGTSHMVVSATLVQNRRVKRLQCFRIEGFCSNSGGPLGKSRKADVCLCVCVHKPLEPELLVRSGRANIHLMHRNSGKRWCRCGPTVCTWHVPRTISRTPAK